MKKSISWNQNPLTYLFRAVLVCKRCLICADFSPDSDQNTFFTAESNIMDYGRILARSNGLKENISWWICFLQTHIFSSQDINWWTGVVWIIVMFLSADLTLILTAPIHIHWWASDVMLHFSKSDEETNFPSIISHQIRNESYQISNFIYTTEESGLSPVHRPSLDSCSSIVLILARRSENKATVIF